jgi:hypothetical protein
LQDSTLTEAILIADFCNKIGHQDSTPSTTAMLEPER